MTAPSAEARALVDRVRERYKAPGNEHVLERDEAATEIDRERDAAYRRGIEDAVHQCHPRGDEAWSRDAIWAGELIEARIRALSLPHQERS